MICKDFREIADSYLSDELLVETNHEVFRHLENCADCRQELAFRSELRAKLRSAVLNAAESQVSPAFTARLQADLRKSVLQETGWTKFWRGALAVKTLAATTAVLLVVLFIGFATFSTEQKSQSTNNPLPVLEKADNESLRTMWRQVSLQAIGDHEHCAVENMDYWQKVSARETPQKAVFRENVLHRVKHEFPENIELLHVHDCVYDGRNFTHAVMRIGGRTVSVLLTESEIASGANNNNEPDSTIICQKQTGFQVASFSGAKKAVFVISDMTEAENLNLARSLSNVMQS